MSSQTERSRVGFVGGGGVAARHASILAGFPDVELVAVTDLDRSRSEAFAQVHGMSAVHRLDSMLRCDLDAVYVCVPPFAHGEIEAAVADAGAALFVEKPLGLDDAVARDAWARLSAAGVVTAVGHHWRYAEPVRQARELLAGRAVRLVNGTWLDKVPPVPWWSRRDRSGGQLVEQVVHVLDLVRALVGEVAEVHALRNPEPPPGDGGTVDVAAAAVLRFDDGPIGTLAASCALGWKHRAGLDIVADGLVLGVGEDWLEVRDGDGPARRSTVDHMTAKVAADRAFVDAVRGRRDVELVDYAEARRSHRLACALARSAATGEPVSLADVDG